MFKYVQITIQRTILTVVALTVPREADKETGLSALFPVPSGGDVCPKPHCVGRGRFLLERIGKPVQRCGTGNSIYRYLHL